MLWGYSFQIGMFEGKLLKMPGLDVGCCTIEEKEYIVPGSYLGILCPWAQENFAAPSPPLFVFNYV
jgi:hypothetical protein